ncbi:ribonuclease P protein subunit [Candidatus Woesearchaeota archaeon]|nr:ribonuclease P protein subunit [Candidatus Woesearchaeota archaeon]
MKKNMHVAAYDLRREEWINQTIDVAAARQASYLGVHGKVLDETKESLLVQTSNGRKRVLKQGVVFKIHDTLIKGNDLRKRPEERIGMKIKTINPQKRQEPKR